MSNDILTLSFITAYKDYDDYTKIHRDEQFNKQSIDLTENIDQVPLVLKLFIDNHIHNDTRFGSVRSNAFSIISQEKISLVIQKMTNV